MPRRPKIDPALPEWMLTAPKFQEHWSNEVVDLTPDWDMLCQAKIDPQPGLTRYDTRQLPNEHSEETMFPDDILAGLGMVPWPDTVYVLMTPLQHHAVARRQDPMNADAEVIGLVAYPSASKAIAACNTERNKPKNYSPAALSFDAAVELAVSKTPTLDCLILFRDPQEPLIHYVR